MTTVNALAHHLAQAQVIKIKTFRQAHLQIKKPVIHALDSHANDPTMLFVARLRIAGHGQALGMLRIGCTLFAHEGLCGDSRLAGAACAGVSMSSSANCRSYSRA